MDSPWSLLSCTSKTVKQKLLSDIPLVKDFARKIKLGLDQFDSYSLKEKSSIKLVLYCLCGIISPFVLCCEGYFGEARSVLKREGVQCTTSQAHTQMSSVFVIDLRQCISRQLFKKKSYNTLFRQARSDPDETICEMITRLNILPKQFNAALAIFSTPKHGVRLCPLPPPPPFPSCFNACGIRKGNQLLRDFSSSEVLLCALNSSEICLHDSY